MPRAFLAFAAFLLSPVHAQTEGLAPYVGTWETAVHGTPGGTVGGTYTVAADGTGTLSMPGAGVWDAAVTGIRLAGDGITGTSTFAEVAGGTTCTITLAPSGDGALAGAMDCGALGSYALDARRAAPASEAGGTAEIQARAQGYVDAFAAAARQSVPADLGETPIVRVANMPQLIFIQGKTIVVPWWEGLPAQGRAFFEAYAPEGRAEQMFRMFFNRFFVAHEAAHWLQIQAQPYAPLARDRYGSEANANRLAVAFWRTQPGGDAFLDSLDQMLDVTLARLPDPTPAGMTPERYFNENYQTLGGLPEQYGYFQFAWVREAIRDPARPAFAGLVAGVAAGDGAPLSTARAVYETLQSDGAEAAGARYHALRAAAPDTLGADENGVNELGYALLSAGRVADAVAVLEINAEAFPDSPNVHDSLGDGLRAAGRPEDARAAYARAVALAEAQGDPRLPTFRANLERAGGQ